MLVHTWIESDGVSIGYMVEYIDNGDIAEIQRCVGKGEVIVLDEESCHKAITEGKHKLALYKNRNELYKASQWRVFTDMFTDALEKIQEGKEVKYHMEENN